jgi:hypothetical protein
LRTWSDRGPYGRTPRRSLRAVGVTRCRLGKVAPMVLASHEPVRGILSGRASSIGRASPTLVLEGLPVKALAQPVLHGRVSSGSAVSADTRNPTNSPMAPGVAPPRRLECGRSHILVAASENDRARSQPGTDLSRPAKRIPSARRSAPFAEHGEMGVREPLLYRIPPRTVWIERTAAPARSTKRKRPRRAASS